MYNEDAVMVYSSMGRTHAAIHRAAMEDPRLSFKAVGIHNYIANQSHWVPRWEANERDIINRHTDGQYAVREGIKELIRFGYANRVKVMQGSRIVDWRLIFYDCPEMNPHYIPGTEGERDKHYVIIDLDEEAAKNRDGSRVSSELENRGHKGKNSDLPYSEDQRLEDQDKSAGSDTPSAPVAEQPPQPKEEPPAPPKPPEPELPSPGRSGFNDLIGQTRNSWFGARSGQRDAMQRQQLAKQAGLDMRGFTAVVDKLIEIHGLRALIDAQDDKSLRQMQDMAIVLGSAPLNVRTVEQVTALFEDWKAANRGKVAPFGNVFSQYASRLHAEGRLQDGHVIGKPAAAGSGGAGNGKGRGRSGGNGRKPVGDGDARIDWTERARERERGLNLPPVPEGDINF